MTKQVGKQVSTAKKGTKPTRKPSSTKATSLPKAAVATKKVSATKKAKVASKNLPSKASLTTSSGKQAPRLGRKGSLPKLQTNSSVVIGVVVGLVVGVLFVALYSVFGRKNQPQLQPQQQATSIQTKIKSYRFSSGDDVFKPADGMRYVVIDVELQHNRGGAMWFSPVVDSYVSDGTTQYVMSPLLGLSYFEARSYAPGETAAGELSYSVPEKSQVLEWCYRDYERFNCTPLW